MAYNQDIHNHQQIELTQHNLNLPLQFQYRFDFQSNLFNKQVLRGNQILDQFAQRKQLFCKPIRPTLILLVRLNQLQFGYEIGPKSSHQIQLVSVIQQGVLIFGFEFDSLQCLTTIATNSVFSTQFEALIILYNFDFYLFALVLCKYHHIQIASPCYFVN
ncbi:Hypothetical_protein [Hexamita inflata]|uniref:Hypothetical_protein n=1 Tax=Hexamita inflata TaxID=28002 RepID=A0AA86V4G5_9EUKA|nr:Hypothetical protein HINF_LOCUS63632 [Hexamita inflata]